MATRTLGPSSGGAGSTSLIVSGSGRYNSGDAFALSSDTLWFPHSPLQRLTVTVPHSSALAVAVPSGARAIFVQTPLGTSENISVTTNSGQRHWYIGPDGIFVSTMPANVTTVYLQATSEQVPDVLIAFV